MFQRNYYKITILLCLVLFYGCTTTELYKGGMQYQRYQAELLSKNANLSIGNIAYLENNLKSEETLVLLHGFGENKDNWNKFVKSLNNKYHVIIPDLLGHGNSVQPKNTNNYSFKLQVKSLKLLLEKKNIKKFHILGNSMGGGIALMYTYLHPKDVKTLTLFDSVGMLQEKSDLMKYIEKTGINPFFDVCTQKKYDFLLSYAFANPLSVPSFIKKELMKEKCARAKVDKIIFKSLLREINSLAEISKKIITKTLIIWGGKDRILDVSNARLFKKNIKNSQLVIFKNVGHMPMIEAPKKSQKVFNNFIKRI